LDNKKRITRDPLKFLGIDILLSKLQKPELALVIAKMTYSHWFAALTNLAAKALPN
jgi:hypothetical protein